MKLFAANWTWTCCTAATEPANETREDDWTVHRDERLKSATQPQAYLSAAALRPLSARPSLIGDDLGGLRYRSISGSTVGPCTPKLVHSQSALEDQDGVSSTSNLSDFLGQLSPRSGMSEADGTASNSTGTMSLRLSPKAFPREHRMSASELLKQASDESPKQGTQGTQARRSGGPQGQPGGPRSSSGHNIDSTAVSQVLANADIRKQDTTPRSDTARSSKVRSARSSSSSQLKARSRSSSSASHGHRSTARKESGRSPSSRSRLDKHLEVSKDDSGPSVQARRSNRATTEQATSETKVPNTEARHRTWSGPEPRESQAKEKGLITDAEALSQWSDGSTALNTKASRDSTSTSRDSCSSPSRSALSGRLLGGSPSPGDTAVILVDWDDTLSPTSWVFEQIRKCPDNKALAAVEKASEDLLREHSMTVVAFLRAARACAQVAVVTLATEDFFHQSADTFLHEVRVKDLFEELGIEVHFAERPAQVSFPAEIDAKKKAMSQCLSKFYAGRHLTRWNVLSVGDSEIELEALKSLLGSKWRSPLCKTVKFDARPTLTQLTAQLKSVTPNLAAMMASSKSFHITSNSKWP